MQGYPDGAQGYPDGAQGYLDGAQGYPDGAQGCPPSDQGYPAGGYIACGASSAAMLCSIWPPLPLHAEQRS